MPAAKVKKRYTCKKCGRKMNNPTAHSKGCPPGGKRQAKSELGTIHTAGLAEAALKAVAAEMSDQEKKRQKLIKLLRQAIEVLES